MVRIGDSMIEMGEAHGELAQPMPPALYVYVETLKLITSERSRPERLHCNRRRIKATATARRG